MKIIKAIILWYYNRMPEWENWTPREEKNHAFAREPYMRFKLRMKLEGWGWIETRAERIARESSENSGKVDCLLPGESAEVRIWNRRF